MMSSPRGEREVSGCGRRMRREPCCLRVEEEEEKTSVTLRSLSREPRARMIVGRVSRKRREREGHNDNGKWCAFPSRMFLSLYILADLSLGNRKEPREKLIRRIICRVSNSKRAQSCLKGQMDVHFWTDTETIQTL